MYRSIQAGRGLAALLVVLFHLGVAVAADKYFGAKAYASAFIFGDSGVDFFFVLSGFIIIWIHLKDFGHPARLLSYLRKRAVRIYPTYWIVFAAVFVLALCSATLRNTVPHDPILILKSLSLIPQDPLVVGGTGAPVLIVAWTLQYEMVFYGLIGAFILNRVAGVAISCAVLAVMVSCVGSACTFPQHFFANELLLLFGVGAAVAVLARSRYKLKAPLLVAAAGALGFAAVALFESLTGDSSLIPGRRLVYGMFSGIAIWGLVVAEDSAKLRMRKGWLSLLGDASYALYLIHYPLISVLCKAAKSVGLSGARGAAVAFPAILITCVATALIFHIAIEKPVLNFLARPAARA